MQVIAGHPVVLIRQKDGSIETLSNVCLHRCTTLLEGAGHLKGAIICPYHAWSYRHDGVLRATPYSEVQHTPECQAGTLRLQRFKTEIWHQWIFVCLDPDAPPLAPQLHGLMGQMPASFLDNFENVLVRDEVWDVNWKLLTENFIESYHLFMIHPKTIEPWAPTRTARFTEGGAAYTLHFCPTLPGKRMEMVQVDGIDSTGGDPNFGIDFCVFPAFMAAGDRAQLWWMTLQPDGPLRVLVRYGFCVSAGALQSGDREEIITGAAAWLDTANSEDKGIVTRVMRGISSPLQIPGRLGGQQDRPVWEFAKYIDRTLNPAAHPGRSHE